VVVEPLQVAHPRSGGGHGQREVGSAVTRYIEVSGCGRCCDAEPLGVATASRDIYLRAVGHPLEGGHGLILTSYDDDEALFAAIMAGASGYVLKEIKGNDLVGGVRQVAAGNS
jgi:hypothetical protein